MRLCLPAGLTSTPALLLTGSLPPQPACSHPARAATAPTPASRQPLRAMRAAHPQHQRRTPAPASRSAAQLLRHQQRRHTLHQPASRGLSLTCHASVVWRQLERSRAWLAHPRSARTKGVVHFIGGAFAGAAPQLLYNSFIEGLADAGYTVVATPYQVTFKHDACARQVRQAFVDSLAELRATGRAYLAPLRAPQFGVGHSNGALLHLLIGAFEPGAADANVIISYNNLQVSDAIPIPGFLDSLQPTVQAARAAAAASNSTTASSTTASAADASSTSGSGAAATAGAAAAAEDARQLLAAAAALPLPEQQALLLAGAGPAIEQLASIVNEVGDGITDFTPSPEASRAIVAAGYACPATLLLQFENDSFDETPEMQRLLLDRQAGAGADSSSGDVSGSAAAAAAAAAASVATLQGGYTSAWSSIDEDVSTDNLLQQLRELQASVALQEAAQQQPQQPLQQQPSGGQLLQQQTLPGSHVTPCGASLPVPVVSLGAGSPFDVLLDSTNQPDSQADQAVLTSTVLAFLDGRRAGGTMRRAAKQQQQQQQQREVAPVAAAAVAAE